MGQPPTIARLASTSNGRPPGSRARLLVVDDDPAVRSVTRGMLERLGYRVQVAADGPAALESYHSAALDPFELVLLDLNMPGMNGAEVLRALRLHDPAVRVLLTSGSPGEELGDLLASGEAVGFLQKPFALDSLREAIGVALPVGGAVLPST